MPKQPLKQVVENLNKRRYKTLQAIDTSSSPLSSAREQMRDTVQHYDSKRPLGRMVMALTPEEDRWLVTLYGEDWHKHWKDIKAMYPELGTLSHGA